MWLLPRNADRHRKQVLFWNTKGCGQKGRSWCEMHHRTSRFCRWLPQRMGFGDCISPLQTRTWLHEAKKHTRVSWILYRIHYTHLQCTSICFVNKLTDVLSFRKYRYTAYRQLVRWCWGFLGKYHRVPLPACAVARIRKEFPQDDARYTGFSYPNLPWYEFMK